MPFLQRRHPILGVLLVLLGVIGAGFLYLSIHVPCFLNGAFSATVSDDESVAIIQQVVTAPFDEQIISETRSILADLRSGRTRPAIDQHFSILIHLDGEAESSSAPGMERRAHWLAPRDTSGLMDVSRACDLDWIMTELRTGRELGRFAFRYRPGYFRVVIDDRFVVAKAADAFEIYDLKSANPIPRIAPTGNRSRWIWGIPNTRNFFVGRNQPSSTPLELYHLDAGGEIRLVKRLGTASPHYSLRSFFPANDGTLATIDQAGRHLQNRSLMTGNVIGTWPLPRSLRPGLMPWMIDRDLFIYNEGKRLRVIRWIEDRVILDVPSTDKHWSRRGNVLTYTTDQGRCFFDLASQQQIGTVAEADGPSFFDRQHAIISSRRNGLSFTKFDLASGQTLETVQPFAYAIPSLITLLIASLIWVAAWIICSARVGSPAWVDQCLLAGASLGLLTFHAVVSGSMLHSDRLVYQFAQGVAMATMTLALLWLVFGTRRVTLRVMPILAVSAVIITVLAIVFRTHLTTAWNALASTMVPVACITVPLLILRALGISIRTDRPRPDAATTPEKRFPIRDLLVVTLLVSLCFAAFRLILTGIQANINVSAFLVPLLAMVILTPMLLASALARWRLLYRFATAAIVVVAVSLAIYPIALFMSGTPLVLPWFLDPTPPPRVLGTFAVCFYSLLLPYRMRGLRLSASSLHTDQTK
jgi:hypothetical protein